MFLRQRDLVSER